MSAIIQKSRSYDLCSCRHCRKARRLEQIEQGRPLDWGDKAWFVAVGAAWVFVVFYGIAAALGAVV